MAVNNSTGITTGINKGEAQVFGDTYNPLFKDELANVKAKESDIKKGVEEGKNNKK